MKTIQKDTIGFSGNNYDCGSCITAEDSYFSTKDGFVQSSNTTNFMDTNAKIENVEMAIYEIASQNLDINEDLCDTILIS